MDRNSIGNFKFASVNEKREEEKQQEICYPKTFTFDYSGDKDSFKASEKKSDQNPLEHSIPYFANFKCNISD